jgi:hypothetical protein
MLRIPRVMLIALPVVGTLANVWLFAFTLRRPAASPPPLPNPKGYDDFAKATGLLTGVVPNACALIRSRKRSICDFQPLQLGKFFVLSGTADEVGPFAREIYRQHGDEGWLDVPHRDLWKMP